ncbi:hypothetical protein BGZ98_009740 [Dissophora globulifera]|nr:hypothetical protein BGZ98_009740 [Dissophora globulifera]
MVEFTAPSRRTVILSISAVVGIVTVSSLAYILLHDDKRTSRSHRLRSLHRGLYSQLLKAQDSLDDLVEHDLRLIQVRAKTLRTHRLYPGDDQVKLPSLGLIINDDDDKEGLGAEIEETKEELVRERTQGFENPTKVRQGYKKLDQRVKALRKQLHLLCDRVDKIDLTELAEVGDETSGVSQENEAEIVVFEKLRKRRRSVLAKIDRTISLLDRISASYKDRLLHIKKFEKLEYIGQEPSDDVEPTVDSEMMKEGVTFADVASLNIEEPDVLAPTEDLKRMKEGVSYAQVAIENISEDKLEHRATSAVVETIKEPTDKEIKVLAPTEDLEKMKHGISFAKVVAENTDKPGTKGSKDTEVLAPTEDLEKMKHGISFADVVAENTDESSVKDGKDTEVLAPTEDLEKMKHGVSFADVVAENTDESAVKDGKDTEVLAPTEDLEKMKHGISFADVVSENTDEPAVKENKDTEVLAPTEDLEKMKHGISFANVVAENTDEPAVKGATMDAEDEVLAPTEDLELMKQGISFADMAKHDVDEDVSERHNVLAPTEDLDKMNQGFSR